MAKPPYAASQIELKVNGNEIELAELQKIMEVIVDQHVHLPTLFTLRLRDPGLAVLEKGSFDLAKDVEIQAINPHGEKFTLIKGEITALEPVFGEGMIAELTVRGYDPSHRLYRQTKSKAYINVRDSDLASEIAREAGLQEEIEATHILYPHVFQSNQSDLAFLMQRAWRIGYECFVSEGKLFFRPPASAEARLTLTWGQDLLSFRPNLSLAEQVDEVIVRGWDPQKQTSIGAGRMVQVEALGERFTGTYLVTRARHIYNASGLHTTFSVLGARSGLLSEQMADRPAFERWRGLVTAIVTNSDDPLGWGRVKVKYPWLTEDVESDWARVLGIGAGPEAGFFVVPEVDDEVLVAFEHGDFGRPCVLGGLWNGQHAVPPEGQGAAGGEKPLVRTWRSRGGHRMVMYDDAEQRVEIVTSDKRRVSLDDKNREIVIQTKDVKIVVGDEQISIESKSEIEVKAGSNLKLGANGSIDIQASGQVNIKGATINLN
jgi:uncharacterized protein involved in type VI secretion and phage assembly